MKRSNFESNHGRAAAMKGKVEQIEANGRSDVLLICDHASNWIPDDLEGLGLPRDQLSRHIAYDIGAAEVTRRLADRLGAQAILNGVSRLVIDLNRGLDDPTLIMKLSDGAIIPGNRHLTDTDAQARIDRFYKPYDGAVSQALDRIEAAGHAPKILSIHSFTPQWRGQERPWKIGLLWDRDDRIFKRLKNALETQAPLLVGDNEPYTGRLHGDCLYRHGTSRGIAHVLIEIRQDLISDTEGVAKWSNILFDALKTALEDAPSGFFDVIAPVKGET